MLIIIYLQVHHQTERLVIVQQVTTAQVDHQYRRNFLRNKDTIHQRDPTIKFLALEDNTSQPGNRQRVLSAPRGTIAMELAPSMKLYVQLVASVWRDQKSPNHALQVLSLTTFFVDFQLAIHDENGYHFTRDVVFNRHLLSG